MMKNVSNAGSITSSRIGDVLESFEIKNRKGMRVTILNYGATIANIEVPDREGKMADVLLGHDDLTKYIGGRFYFGATIGRVANRIAGGRFCLDGKEYHVTVNNNGNMLHGGSSGFDKKIWTSRIIHDAVNPSVEMSLISPDGDEGFPGALQVKVTYVLTDDNDVHVLYNAVTDTPTVINLTNHAYFNLTGSSASTISDHVLTINASQFIPIDSRSIPLGTMATVENTPMDFRTPSVIGTHMNKRDGQLEFARGFDHTWVIRNYSGVAREAATLFDPVSGRVMEVWTDQPGLQFYSGNYLDGTLRGKKGACYIARSGLCLECQHYPNSPNVETFPSVVLRPGEEYRQNTTYKFSVN
jgi:aldose 1-epimerase